MFRDRTNLFLSYRRTIPRRPTNNESRFVALAEEEESLMTSGRFMGSRKHYQDKEPAGGDIEMKPLAPSIFDISNLLDENLATIKTKTHELSLLYKKLLITRDNEKLKLENHIEELNYELTKMFEACYVLIKKFEFLQKNYQRLQLDYSADELSMIQNYKKTYALKIQDSLVIFRNLQNNYIKFLKDDDDETDQLLSAGASTTDLVLEEENSKNIEDYSKKVLLQAQEQIQHGNSQLLAQREREISKLAMGILEISTIFKEMETLVVEQGSMLDRIDYNMSRTVEDLKTSDKELIKAQGYQKRTTKCKIIFLLSLIVLALFILVVVKPHGTTKIVEKPTPELDLRPSPENNQSNTQENAQGNEQESGTNV
ncbi:CIC11C00000004096 [Sungouiella intermedia]|uniref:CIC11C00000004096 n=1 Tax=Sungouiella intermedia TaxID=45354 RepID=A0A1L0BDG4_9ASCO|nr:CIC11C00000004096 [[Candida] intermedia]